MRRSELAIRNEEAIEGLLNLFVYAERRWCEWDKLEEAIAKVDYEKLSDEYLEWFVDFLANCCFRVWRNTEPDNKLNRVEEAAGLFLIKNFDWNAFRFGMQHKLDKYVATKNVIAIDMNSLSEKEIKWLRSRCK